VTLPQPGALGRAHGWLYLCTWCWGVVAVSSLFQRAEYNVSDCTVPEKFGPKSNDFFVFTTWPQSRSVHTAVSLQPEKLEKN
jgi:hypothetical protein